MARATESGAYLGGIGTMLAQTEVCPHCGSVQHRARVGVSPSGDCPHVVFGTFPILTDADDERTIEEEVPVSRAPSVAPAPPSLPEPARLARRSGGLSILWPMPTEEYL